MFEKVVFLTDGRVDTGKEYNIGGFIGKFFSYLFFEIICIYLVVALFDLVHDVKAIFHLH